MYISLMKINQFGNTCVTICSACRNPNPGLSSLVSCHWIVDKSSTSGATSGEGTAHSSGAPKTLLRKLKIGPYKKSVQTRVLRKGKQFQIH